MATVNVKRPPSAQAVRRAATIRPYYIAIGKIKPRDPNKLFEPAVGFWPVFEQGAPSPHGEWDPAEFLSQFEDYEEAGE